MKWLAVILVAVAAGWAGLTALEDPDQPVDPAAPGARAAIAEATRILPGRVVGVARDTDDDKWEVTINQEGREYEVELDPATLSLLRLDYD